MQEVERPAPNGMLEIEPGLTGNASTFPSSLLILSLRAPLLSKILLDCYTFFPLETTVLYSDLVIDFFLLYPNLKFQLINQNDFLDHMVCLMFLSATHLPF